MRIFELTKDFPSDERYSLTSQIRRRSSRSVCASIAEAWRKRRYPAYFVSKLTDAEGEAEETRVWIEFARLCEYTDEAEFRSLDEKYDHILGQIVLMITKPEDWSVPR